MLIKIHACKYASEIAEMVDTILDIYKQNAVAVSPKRFDIFERFARYCEIIFKFGNVLYVSAPFLYLIYPFHMYLFENKIVTLLPLFLPKVDEESAIGYGILTVFHLSLLIFALLASSASDFLFIMIITNIPALVKAFGESVKDLNNRLLKEKENVAMTRLMLRNVILMHKEIHE